jgi:branched-chain amino acid transport system ATP-binding protein
LAVNHRRRLYLLRAVLPGRHLGRGAEIAIGGGEAVNVLELEHLNCAFGKLVVTDDVCLTIGEGERHVIIGPNGAGKTSLINQIGGQLKPAAGRILVNGEDVTGKPPSWISRKGVARTFQRNNLFYNLSVIENLRLALAVRFGNPLDFFSVAARDEAMIGRARQLLQLTHLSGREKRIVRTLSYGEQRQLEIAIALAGAPKLLLLDEPTSGMSPAETARMVELIAALPRSLSMLMIEHDMSVVFSIADRITVLYYGKIIITDAPAAIQANERVQEIYLGMAH